MTASPDYDAIVVGAGFAGVYALYKLRQLNLSVLLIDNAEDVGGIWYWNRYPGASSDVHSFVFRYSFDKEDLRTYPWPNLYLTQPEVQDYLRNVVDKHDLRKYIQFKTDLIGAEFDESNNLWKIETSQGRSPSARYLVTGLGQLTKKNIPDIKNFQSFGGEIYHTGAWPAHHDFSNKRVGVIGNGSTGSQIVVALAREAKHVTSFQRNPQWNVPNGNRPVTDEERADINAHYDEIWDGVRNSAVAFGFPESTTPAFSVSEEERQRIFQKTWDQGNGFRFMFAAFSDITTDEKANKAATDFIRGKITEIVKDPETARRLIPTEVYARRPICNDGYYEVFNQENVSLVSLKETPFKELTPTGAVTSDGVEHPLDALVLATGFDAVTGSYTRLTIRGRGGKTVNEHWADSPSSNLGVAVPGFPNLFTISGPGHPFTNTPPQTEAQVDFIVDLIKHAGTQATVETTPEAEKEWTEVSNKVVEGSLFHKTRGWVFGDNIPGKKHSPLFFFGGLKDYRERQAQIIANGYTGFNIRKID
ncbi:cyclohexanone monooxygenase [Xylariales sp. AK1849]|nr:cyclohexanone monooxygenase [Xylariales sp. AK1849]